MHVRETIRFIRAPVDYRFFTQPNCALNLQLICSLNSQIAPLDDAIYAAFFYFCF